MLKLLKRFPHEEDGQDFAEYALILGAVGVVAIPPAWIQFWKQLGATGVSG